MTTRAGADEVVYRPSGSDDENDAPTLDPTPTRSGIFGASPATPLPDRPSSATARARSPRIPSLPTRRRRRVASAPTPPRLRPASDPNRRSPTRTYLPRDTQARSSA